VSSFQSASTPLGAGNVYQLSFKAAQQLLLHKLILFFVTLSAPHFCPEYIFPS